MSKLCYTAAQRMSAAPLSRRELLKMSAAGIVGGSVSGWLEGLAQAAAQHPQATPLLYRALDGGRPQHH